MAGYKERTRVVISFYDRRTTDHLERLLNRISQFSAGTQFDPLVVVNSTGETRIDPTVAKRAEVLYRENTGMNIGAWHHGWQSDPTFDRYVFLQDECFPIRNNWLRMIVAPLDDPGIWLVGESFNPSWDHPWDVLERVHRGSELPGHLIHGRPANRVAAYLHAMKTWGIDPGLRGQHLRSLVWGLRRDTLDRLGGFPIGENYGECIAAEIGVSRAIAAIGQRLQQVAVQPFYGTVHFEWNADSPLTSPSHKKRDKSLGQERSRAELDQEAKVAWDRAVRLAADQKGDAGIIALLALELKLADREKEIARLRGALLKIKQ